MRNRDLLLELGCDSFFLLTANCLGLCTKKLQHRLLSLLEIVRNDAMLRIP